MPGLRGFYKGTLRAIGIRKKPRNANRPNNSTNARKTNGGSNISANTGPRTNGRPNNSANAKKNGGPNNSANTKKTNGRPKNNAGSRRPTTRTNNGMLVRQPSMKLARSLSVKMTRSPTFGANNVTDEDLVALLSDQPYPVSSLKQALQWNAALASLSKFRATGQNSNLNAARRATGANRSANAGAVASRIVQYETGPAAREIARAMLGEDEEGFDIDVGAICAEELEGGFVRPLLIKLADGDPTIGAMFAVVYHRGTATVLGFCIWYSGGHLKRNNASSPRALHIFALCAAKEVTYKDAGVIAATTFSRIGSTIMRKIKAMWTAETGGAGVITLDSVDNAREFYFKQGFRANGTYDKFDKSYPLIWRCGSNKA